MPRTALRPRAREWESVASAADYARVSAKTIRRRIADGSLPAHRLGPQLLRIDRADLDRLFRPVPTAGNGAA
jgi:excisionase family DNA binding protein